MNGAFTIKIIQISDDMDCQIKDLKAMSNLHTIIKQLADFHLYFHLSMIIWYLINSPNTERTTMSNTYRQCVDPEVSSVSRTFSFNSAIIAVYGISSTESDSSGTPRKKRLNRKKTCHPNQLFARQKLVNKLWKPKDSTATWQVPRITCSPSSRST